MSVTIVILENLIFFLVFLFDNKTVFIIEKLSTKVFGYKFDDIKLIQAFVRRCSLN